LNKKKKRMAPKGRRSYEKRIRRRIVGEKFGQAEPVRRENVTVISTLGKKL